MPNAASAEDIVLSHDGKKAYIPTGGEWRILDITDPLHATFLGSDRVIASIVALSPDETRVYVGGGDGVYIYDVLNPSAPQFIGYTETWNPVRIRLSPDGGTAYVLDDGGIGFGGVRIIDVRD